MQDHPASATGVLVAPSWGLSPTLLTWACPFHLVLDHELRIRQAGPSIEVLCPHLSLGTPLCEVFELASPKIEATFEALRARARSLFLLKGPRGATLRGQMLYDADSDVLVFVGSPWITDVAALTELGLTLNDFAVSDSVIDYLLLLQRQAGSLAQAQELAAALRSSEQRTRRIIETANDAFIELSADGRVTGWNARAEQMFGWSRDEALGRQYLEILVPKGLHRAAQESLTEAFAGAASGQLVRAGDARALRRDGTLIPVETAIWGTCHDGRTWLNVCLRDISDRKDAEQRSAQHAAALAHQALHDPLTALANRTLMQERLAHALTRRGAATSVLMLDLDNFKTVNDVLGHAAGDHLLVEIARRLSSSLRAGELVARLGGDEFAIVVEEGDPVALADRILDVLKAPVTLAGRQLAPGASIGIATGHSGTAVHDLLVQADLAMYAAKGAGKGRVARFDASMADAIRERVDLQVSLESAVEAGEIVVHYQPVVDVRTESVPRVEALVRWRRGEALAAPHEFLPLAEESGLIVEIGYEVLRQSCQQLHGWLRADAARSFAVNVSTRQLAQPDFAARVLALLAEYDVRPPQLVLELTETLFVQTTAELLEQLQTLRGHGIRVSIDHFGTGYSSLGRLQALAIDSLKIDKSFVDLIRTGNEDLPIITSMILTAHALGLDVTAQGVETAAQAERLVALGVDYLQGYLFARPQSSSADDGPITEGALTAWRKLPTSEAATPVVLLIEDDAVSRSIVQMSLLDSAFSLTTADCASDGIALADRIAPSCVIVDLCLPDADGIDVVRTLRSKPAMAGTAILVLTGTAHRETKSRAFAAGADDYLVKPIVPADLAARLHGAMRAVARSRANMRPDRGDAAAGA